MPAQQLDRDLAAEHGIHVREPRQERRHLGRREREHQRADRVARDVGAGVDEQARHRLARPALALGELVHDAGHRALRVDAAPARPPRRTTRAHSPRRAAPGAASRKTGRAGGRACGSPRMRRPTWRERMKRRAATSRPSARATAFSRSTDSPRTASCSAFHSSIRYGRWRAGQARQRGRLALFDRDAREQRPPGGDHALVEARLERGSSAARGATAAAARPRPAPRPRRCATRA